MERKERKNSAINTKMEEKKKTVRSQYNMKSMKSTEIDSYLGRKSTEIDSYLGRKSTEIDSYLGRKSTEIDSYLGRKSTEIDPYLGRKSTEIDPYLGRRKSTEIDSILGRKSTEIDSILGRKSKENAKKKFDTDQRFTTGACVSRDMADHCCCYDLFQTDQARQGSKSTRGSSPGGIESNALSSL
ncbi:hypothetical protein RRG08_003317 [Elysia crispata]|uniref:Uncharacterized protein n=1 Tax=Elysia crispata TaxID=231223 RepID=A0AAE0ZVX0_9GAST|nr:hypothetical protein RRG08_003317 [Elysia crispata]